MLVQGLGDIADEFTDDLAMRIALPVSHVA
jgi:hypothetical protein